MSLFYILILLLNFTNCYNIPLFLAKNEKTKVLLHLERFNERYNLLHIGISFSSENKNIRYDFRPYSESVGYLTTTMNRREFSNIFPELEVSNDFEEQYRRYRDAIIFDTQKLYTKVLRTRQHDIPIVLKCIFFDSYYNCPHNKISEISWSSDSVQKLEFQFSQSTLLYSSSIL